MAWSFLLLLTPTKHFELAVGKQEYCGFKLYKQKYKQTQFHNLKPQSFNDKWKIKLKKQTCLKPG